MPAAQTRRKQPRPTAPSSGSAPRRCRSLAVLSALSALPSLASANEFCSTSLSCRHGSTCADGDADYGFLTKFPDLPFLSTVSVDGHHCDCPADRTAVNCGTKITVCDTETGFSCFDNAECLADGKGGYTCDCNTAHKDGKTLFAGKYCEHEFTAMCDADEDGLEVAVWFCVNDGVCRDNESDIARKCNCPSDWTGPHCEFRVDSPDAPKAEECTLDCQNGGQCKFGAKDHGEHSGDEDSAFQWEKEEDGMHCVCPENYVGLKCEVEAEKCGREHCYHGSKCVAEEGGTRSHCDCTTARRDGKDGEGKKSYAGRYCEHESTTFCDPVEGNSASLFCTNGGKCNEDEPHKGCDCEGTGHEGPLCEYPEGTEPECTLDCKNGGQCRHGINPDVAGILGTKFDLSLPSHSGFMHCSCPEGYIGFDCGTEYEVCGPKEEMHHACVNGGKCIKTGKNKNGKDKYACDCGGKNPFAGQHCEHAATQFCAKSEEAEGSYHSFCANGGKCVEEISASEAHPGCRCPDEWEGDHCQYRKGTSPVQEVTSGEWEAGKSSSSSGGGGGARGAAVGVAIAITVLSVLALMGIFVHVKMRRMANAKGGGVTNLAPAASYDDAEDNRPGRSGRGGSGKNMVNLDGQMHDVEII